MTRLSLHRTLARKFRNTRVLRSGLTLTVIMAACLQGGCRTEQPWPLWDNYVKSAIDGQGRVIDHSAGDRTTSEGQAYAMFFALVANDRSHFDSILSWTETNLAGGDLTLRLPAWSWGKAPDGSWKVLDPNPAADSDLWIAYDLLEAGRLWRDPRFEKLGNVLATRIAQQEVVLVPGLGTTLLSGAVGFHPDDSTWILNPSYLPPFILAHLAKVQPTGPWATVLDSLDPMLSDGSAGGFAMDWVTAGNSGIRPGLSPMQRTAINKLDAPFQGKLDTTPIGSYDAIRVYLWLGLADPATPGLHNLLSHVNGMAAYLKDHVTPPQIVDSAGRIVDTNAPPGFSAAVVPYLTAVGLKTQARVQMDRLSATRDASSGLYGKNGSYYDQNLALFATGWSEQRFRFDKEGKLNPKWK